MSEDRELVRQYYGEHDKRAFAAVEWGGSGPEVHGDRHA
jgi:hypothetical protein